MKIVFCLGGLDKGGAERVICNMSNYLSDNGHDVYILPTKINSIEYNIDSKVIIQELDNRKYSDFLLRNIQILKNMVNIINKIRPDVIVSFLQEPTFRNLLIKKFNKRIKDIPLIVSLRNEPRQSFKGIKGKVLLKLYSNADGFVFQTNQIRDFFDETIKSKSVVIPNPLDPVFFADKFSGVRQKKIVSVGRLETQKNYPLLLEAFTMFHKNYGEYHLFIYGDGSLKEQLEKIVSKNGLDNYVHFEGKVMDLKEKIIDASLFVLSSNYEGLSNALMEAMALGIPCISTDSLGGGAASLIKNGQNGLLVPINDVNRLCAAMEKVIGSSELSERLSNNSWKYMRNFSSEKINNIWGNYILEIVNKKRGR